MIINNNISSLTAINALRKNELSMNKSIEKLSSGFRINRAADDAAGLAVSETMRSQLKGLDVAKRNVQDGISLLQTAEGALDEVHNMLQRMKELAVQAQNGTYSATDKANLNAEVTQLAAQIGSIATSTNFNEIKPLAAAAEITLQVGVTKDDIIKFSSIDATAGTLGVDGIDVSKAESLAAIDKAIGTISTSRATLGAVQNRLEHTLANVTNQHENLSAAESRIRDVDMAKEMANFSAKQVLLQAGMSVAAQANQKTQLVAKILG